MRRLATFGILLILILLVMTLSQPVMVPQDFAGRWYSSSDQCAYLFEEGLIYCPKYPIDLSDTEYISGAYTCCRDSIFLFVSGIDGLETEKELYLVRKDDGSFLCDHADGSGKVYFIRSNQA